VAHGYSIVNGDRVELTRDTASLDDGVRNDSTYRLEMRVPGDEFCEAVCDGDDWLSKVGTIDAGGAEQRTCADHIAAVSDCS
jgi:hypothetical protein